MKFLCFCSTTFFDFCCKARSERWKKNETTERLTFLSSSFAVYFVKTIFDYIIEKMERALFFSSSLCSLVRCKVNKHIKINLVHRFRYAGVWVCTMASLKVNKSESYLFAIHIFFSLAFPSLSRIGFIRALASAKNWVKEQKNRVKFKGKTDFPSARARALMCVCVFR